eukprot:1391542-Amorphochlora_amoeboformis.AAC.1
MGFNIMCFLCTYVTIRITIARTTTKGSAAPYAYVLNGNIVDISHVPMYGSWLSVAYIKA